MERQNKRPHKTLQEVFNENDKSWIGVNSIEQAKDMFLNGWQQNVEKMKIAFKKELDTLEHDSPRKMVNSVAGFVPIVSNAVMGLPNSMIDVRMSPKKSKILNFMVSISKAGYNSAETVISKMSKIFAYIAMLERSGQYRCRISVFGKASSPYDTKTLATFSVLVKNENQLFDIKRLCFPVIHPAMLRLFSFAWAESLPLDLYDYYDSGYGTGFEHWNEEHKIDLMNAYNENGEKTICLDLNSDMETLLGKEVAQVDSKKVGMNVKIARVKKNMTIQELAKKAGMSVTTISQLERGVRNVRMLSLNKIANALEIDVETLIG